MTWTREQIQHFRDGAARILAHNVVSSDIDVSPEMEVVRLCDRALSTDDDGGVRQARKADAVALEVLAGHDGQRIARPEQREALADREYGCGP